METSFYYKAGNILCISVVVENLFMYHMEQIKQSVLNKLIHSHLYHADIFIFYKKPPTTTMPNISKHNLQTYQLLILATELKD